MTSMILNLIWAKFFPYPEMNKLDIFSYSMQYKLDLYFDSTEAFFL